MLEGTRLHKLVEDYHQGVVVGGHPDWDEVRRYAVATRPDDYVEIEHKFSQEIGDHEFTGIIDRWAAGGVYDLKTTSKSISQTKLDPPLGQQGFGYFESYGLQATAYLYHIYKLTGDILPFHFLIWRKDTKTNGDIYPLKDMVTVRNLADFKMFESLVEDVAADITKEQQFPCTCHDNAHAWAEKTEVTV